MTNSAPLTERRYVAPFILITSLFFLWAFGVNLNDILIPRFKNAFALSDFQSSFIQVAFFSGYCLAALPAGRLGKDRLQARYPYRFGFVRQRRSLIRPASVVGTYAFFLVALFVMACGQSFLEVAANPYVTILGPGVSSERRLNLAQSFNAVGAVCAMLLGLFILSGKELTPEQRAALSLGTGASLPDRAGKQRACSLRADCVHLRRCRFADRHHASSGSQRKRHRDRH
jgi:MFS transporter, FHS family, L-fucose permease